MKNINFPQAIDGYFLFARARHLSEYTIRDYRNTYKKFHTFIGDDVFLDEIASSHIQSFLAMQNKVKKKTVLNYHIGLSALWTWAITEKLVTKHIVQTVPRPKPEKTEILPYTEIEVKALFATLKRSRAYKRPGKKKTTHILPEAERNRVILLLLIVQIFFCKIGQVFLRQCLKSTLKSQVNSTSEPFFTGLVKYGRNQA